MREKTENLSTETCFVFDVFPLFVFVFIFLFFSALASAQIMIKILTKSFGRHLHADILDILLSFGYFRDL